MIYKHAKLVDPLDLCAQTILFKMSPGGHITLSPTCHTLLERTPKKKKTRSKIQRLPLMDSKGTHANLLKFETHGIFCA